MAVARYLRWQAAAHGPRVPGRLQALPYGGGVRVDQVDELVLRVDASLLHVIL